MPRTAVAVVAGVSEMGLLDVFLKGTGDPERDAAINNGLLTAGLALMQSRGKLFPALGQAGMVGMQATNQYRQQQDQRRRGGLQDKLLQGQVTQQQREQEIAALPGQFYRAPSTPGVDATGGMETALENPANAAGPGGFDMQGYIQALRAKSPMQAFQMEQTMRKDRAPIKVGKDETLLDNETLKPVFSNVQPDKPTSDIQNWQEAVKGGYRGSLFEYQKELRAAGGTRVTVPVSMNTDKTYTGEMARQLAGQDSAIIDSARSAPERLRGAQEVRRIIKQTPITGTFAEQRLGIEKALSTAGIVDGQRVKSTEDLVSVLAGQTLDAIKSSGLGSGQGFTDKDRAFLEKARSGNITINAETLNYLADMNERSARESIKKGNSVIKRLQAEPGMGRTGAGLEEIQIPGEIRMPTAADIAAEAARRQGRR